MEPRSTTATVNSPQINQSIVPSSLLLLPSQQESNSNNGSSSNSCTTIPLLQPQQQQSNTVIQVSPEQFQMLQAHQHSQSLLVASDPCKSTANTSASSSNTNKKMTTLSIDIHNNNDSDDDEILPTLSSADVKDKMCTIK